MALLLAFLVNAAIVVLAAIVFYGKESVTVAGGAVVHFTGNSDWIRVAYLTLVLFADLCSIVSNPRLRT